MSPSRETDRHSDTPSSKRLVCLLGSVSTPLHWVLEYGWSNRSMSGLTIMKGGGAGMSAAAPRQMLSLIRHLCSVAPSRDYSWIGLVCFSFLFFRFYSSFVRVGRLFTGFGDGDIMWTTNTTAQVVVFASTGCPCLTLR